MIGISKCLCGYDCTYRGDSNNVEALELIDKKGEAVLICPEVLGGLSIPRDPAEIVSEDPLCVQTVSGKNVTKEYVEGAQKALEILKAYDIEYVILKSRSPSCGLDHIYDGTFSHTIIDADGIFVRLLKKEGYKIYTEENFLQEL